MNSSRLSCTAHQEVIARHLADAMLWSEFVEVYGITRARVEYAAMLREWWSGQGVQVMPEVYAGLQIRGMG